MSANRSRQLADICLNQGASGDTEVNLIEFTDKTKATKMTAEMSDISDDEETPNVCKQSEMDVNRNVRVNSPKAQRSISSDVTKHKPRPMLVRTGRALSIESEPGIVDMMGWKDRRSRSLVEELLFDIYDRWHYGHRGGFDSDTFTECSSLSDAFAGRSDMVLLHSDEQKQGARLSKAYLANKEVAELRHLRQELQRHVTTISARLIRQLKRKDRRLAKTTRNCDVITAILQASSLKRRVDSQIKFTIKPLAGDDAFCQWKHAMRAVARLPLGLPTEFRKKVWLALADNHLESLQIDWHSTKKFAFNEKSNPDDNKLGLQIVKDLHRTGCSGFSGQDNEEERALLKRVLLAYARWNKDVGYCQGFNVLAALILDVMERQEDDALKVMIYLIDHVLPNSYFANNLRALSVDMAVFRDLLQLKLPQLAKHLDHLQAAARDDTTGANYEPPLTNVFTMQWFLTLFATCLPTAIALRIWDSVLLEGSEIMLRTALAIWTKLESRIMVVQDADEFYTTMGVLTQEMLESSILSADSLVKTIYTMAPFPFPQLEELREKYTYNITPFSAAMSTGGQRSKRGVTSIFSDDDDVIDEDEIMESIGCFTGMLTPAKFSPSKLSESDRSASTFDMSKISPGAYAATPQQMTLASSHAERMNLNLSSLKQQYSKVRQRQKQAHIILSAANARHQAKLHRGRAPMQVKAIPATVMAPIESPVAVNHLFLGRTLTLQQKCQRKNRTVVEAPKIASMYDIPTKHLGAASKSKLRSRVSTSSDSSGAESSMKDVNGLRGCLHAVDRSMSVQSIDSETSATGSWNQDSKSTLSVSTSDVSTICGDCDTARSDDVLHGRQRELCDKEINEETGETMNNPQLNDSDSSDSNVLSSTEEINSSPSLLKSKDKHSIIVHSQCDTDGTDENQVKCDPEVKVQCQSEVKVQCDPEVKSQCQTFESEGHINNASVNTYSISNESATPDTQNIVANSASHVEDNQDDEDNSPKFKQVTHHHVYPTDGASSGEESPSPTYSPMHGYRSPVSSRKSSKMYNPFPSQHINNRRTTNGVKLGLYCADNVPQLEVGMMRGRALHTIGRQQINACLHRQYMAEVKKQAKVAK